MTQFSLLKKYPRKPRIEFKITKRSRLKISIVLLENLKDLQYYIDETDLSPERKVLLTIVFEDIIDYIKFWRRIFSNTDFYQKYTSYPNKNGSKLTWYFDHYQVDPYNLLSGYYTSDIPRNWCYIQITENILFIYTEGLTKCHLYNFNTHKHIYEITPDAEDLRSIGVIIKE